MFHLNSICNIPSCLVLSDLLTTTLCMWVCSLGHIFLSESFNLLNICFQTLRGHFGCYKVFCLKKRLCHLESSALYNLQMKVIFLFQYSAHSWPQGDVVVVEVRMQRAECCP